MTLVLSRAAQTYQPLANGSPRAVTLTPSIPANATNVRQITITISRVGWPPGRCLDVEIIDPDGDSRGVVGFDGGTTKARDGSDNSILGIRQDGTPEEPQGPLPTGQYTVRVTIYQAFTAAFRVDRE